MTTADATGQQQLRTSAAPDLFRRLTNVGTRHERLASLLAMGLAFVVHAGVGGVAITTPFEIGEFVEQVRASARTRAAVMFEIDAEPAPEPEASPEPEPEPEPEPPPEPIPNQPVNVPTDQPTTEAPAPAAAEAGAVLTADPEPDAPLDLTDQGFISGTGTRFAGGTTAATGTSATAVRNPGAVAQGQPNAKGTEPGAPPVVNRSRPAGLGGVSQWKMPFPAEADAENINQAVVRMVVVVGPDGRPKSVTLLSDPGNGFGREAKRFAMTQMYEPPLDANGKPTTAPSPPFAVRFKR